MKCKSFKRKWSKLKQTLSDEDFKLFYEIVDIDNTVGRVLTCSERDYNPRFMSHWFPVCRCHWNVLFPLWLLNNRSLTGDYAIITNDMHSALIYVPSQTIYDSTYDADGGDLEETKRRLIEKPAHVIGMVAHAARVDKEIFERLVKFLPEKEHAEAKKQIENLLRSDL